MFQINKKEITLSILNIICALSFVSLAYFSKYIIDFALNKDLNNLICFIIIFSVCLIIGLIIKLIFNYLSINYLIKYKKEYKNIIYNKLIKESFDSNRELSNKIMNYNDDINNIINFKLNVIPNIVFNVSRLIFASILLLLLNYYLLLCLLIIFLFVFVFARFYHKYLKNIQVKRLSEESNLNTYFKDSIINKDLIYSYNAYLKFNNYHDVKLNNYLNILKKENNFKLLANNIMLILNYILMALIIILGSFLAYKELITYGFIIALIQIINHIANPITSLSNSINSLSIFNASKERLNIKEEIINNFINDFDFIIFENVNFSLKGKNILNNFNYKINKYDVIQIVGESGIGKSTLIKLLLGIYQPDSGNIYYSLNNKLYDTKNSVNLVSYLSQEIKLINGTIYENFKLYSDITKKEIYYYLELVNLDDRIKDLDELINNEKLNLSVGEKQRLMFSIMLSTNRKIIVLDEFDSNLDKNNTNILINILNNINKTIIYISHKESAIENTKKLEIIS